jgi:cysteinyl-tRNA synthetase
MHVWSVGAGGQLADGQQVDSWHLCLYISTAACLLSRNLAPQERLGCLPPALEPRATDFIPQMVSMIQRIISHGHAYAVDGDVYFDVASLPGYGRLSGRAQVRGWVCMAGLCTQCRDVNCLPYQRLLYASAHAASVAASHASSRPAGGQPGW